MGGSKTEGGGEPPGLLLQRLQARRQRGGLGGSQPGFGGSKNGREAGWVAARPRLQARSAPAAVGWKRGATPAACIGPARAGCTASQTGWPKPNPSNATNPLNLFPRRYRVTAYPDWPVERVKQALFKVRASPRLTLGFSALPRLLPCCLACPP